jgi:hypothetical protein
MYGNDWEVVQDMGAKPRSIQESLDSSEHYWPIPSEWFNKHYTMDFYPEGPRIFRNDDGEPIQLSDVMKHYENNNATRTSFKNGGELNKNKKIELSELWGYDNEFSSYEDAVEHAKAKSKFQGVVQHVNEIPRSLEDSYIVSNIYDDKATLSSFKNGRQLNENKKDNNKKTQIKESMKRLKFKNEFKGLGNALKLIPEAYKVDNKTFEMTDGNESYKIRWEGNLSEGRAVVLTAADKKLVNEDITRMKELFGYKSHETLGLVKGNARIDENKAFTDVWNKTRALMTESEEIESVNADEGYWEEETKSAPEATKHIQGSTSNDKGTQAPAASEGDLDDAVSHASEAKKHVEGSVSTDKGTQAPKPKEGHWEDAGVTQAAEATKHVHLKESEEIEEAEMETEGYDIMKEEPMDVTEMMDKMMKEEEEMEKKK